MVPNDILAKTLEVLNAGGVILYPTDTVWGLGCDATNSAAVKRIYEIKRRADSKAMLTLIDAAARVDYFFDRVPEIAWDLWEVADKPLTLILPRARNVAQELIATDGTMGMRITNEEVSKTLCSRLKRPLVSTSANISGEPSPRCFAEISEEIKSQVDYIVNFRRGEKSAAQPSHIVKLGKNGEVKVIR